MLIEKMVKLMEMQKMIFGRTMRLMSIAQRRERMSIQTEEIPVWRDLFLVTGP